MDNGEVALHISVDYNHGRFLGVQTDMTSHRSFV